MQNIIQALKSRTVQLAVIQAILGLVIIILTEADMVGYATMLKSVVDIFLRADTNEPLSAK